MVVRRRPLLLLLCLAALTVSVAGKKCRDKKTAKGCVKKRAKNFCQEESSCPKLKKGGKKCKKTRKSCRLTCGLCTPGVDPLTNQPINPNYVAPVNTALTSMMTACSCTPAATASKGPQQTGDDPNSATAPVYATVGGWDMTTGMAPPYFCVKTEYKGVDSEIAVNVCNAGVGAQNAASCPGGMQACGPTGFPRPPPSASPMKPPPPPSTPAKPPPVLPPSSPPPPSPPPACSTLITTRVALVAEMNRWCSTTVPNHFKNPLKRCAPSTWNVKIGAEDLSSLFDPTHFNTLPIPVATPGSACVANVWGKPGVSLEAGVLLASAAGVTYDDMNSWDVSGVTDMNVRPPPAPRGQGRWECLGASRSTRVPSRRRQCSQARPYSTCLSTDGTSRRSPT